MLDLICILDFWISDNCYKIKVKITGKNVHISIRLKQRASLVAQWERIHLPMQEMWVRFLIREDPTCRGATKPMCHNN